MIPFAASKSNRGVTSNTTAGRYICSGVVCRQEEALCHLGITHTSLRSYALPSKTTLRGQTEPLIQVQEVPAGSSYLSMDSIDLEFGVGAAMVIEEITILWPSGRKQVLNDISVDQVIAMTEPQQ